MKKILLGLTFFLCCTIYSQEKLELLEFNPVEEYTQDFIDSLQYSYASGFRRVRLNPSALKAVLENNQNLKGWLYYNLAKASRLYGNDKFDSIIFYIDKSIELYNSGKENRKIDEHLLIRSFYLKGQVFNDLERYPEAILNYQKSLNLTKKYAHKWKGYILGDIASIHLTLGDNEKAFGYYKQIELDTIYMNIPRSLVSTLTRLGVLYEEKDDLKLAKRYYRKAIDASLNTSYKTNLPALYGNLGNLLYLSKNIDSTIFYYKKAIRSAKEFELEGSYKLFNNYQLYYQAFINFHEQKYKVSEDQLIQIITSIRAYEVLEKNDRKLLEKIVLLLTKMYAKTGGNENFEELSNEIFRLINITYEVQLEKNISDLELKYQTKEKDASILQLEETTQTQNTILKQRTTINWVLSGLLLSFLGLGFLFFKQRQLKNKFVASNLEQRLLRSQLNPHFLYNALNSVSSLVQEKSENTIPYISKLGSLLRSILKNSRQEFVSLEEELDTINTYLELQSDFSEKFQYEIQLPTNIDQEAIIIPPMFIQPFIENAIQHGFQGINDEKITIKIQFEEKNKTLHIEIQDNGIGYNESMKLKDNKLSNESLSGKILQERLSIYAKSIRSKAYYKIKDIEKGTEVYLCLPYVLDV